MMKYYLSGPMRGLNHHGYERFASVTHQLREAGYDIMSPHEINPEGTPRNICMTADIAEVLHCDAILTMPGWEQSSGACTEVNVAWALSLPHFDVRMDGPTVVGIEPARSFKVQVARELQYYLNIPLVGLCGYARAGKDTIAQYLVFEHGWQRVALGDKLREALYAIDPYVDTNLRLSTVVDKVGWEDAKNMLEVRSLLQRFGTEAGRNLLGENLWTGLAEEQIETGLSPTVVTDCRFSSDTMMIKRRGGTLVWVERPGIGPINAHASEHQLGPEDCAFTIVNDGSIGDLQKKAHVLLGEPIAA